jgi:hypothetical protein
MEVLDSVGGVTEFFSVHSLHPKYNKGMADTLLIYNPAAGRISVRPFISGVIRTLSDHGLRVEVAESLNGRHTTQLARMAAQEFL